MPGIKTGNFDDIVSENPQNRRWVLGHFMSDPLLQDDNVEICWARHEKGWFKLGKKEKVTTKTLVILISGRFQINFPEIKEVRKLEKLGDFVLYDAGEVLHSAEAPEECLVLVVRWPSVRPAA